MSQGGGEISWEALGEAAVCVLIQSIWISRTYGAAETAATQGTYLPAAVCVPREVEMHMGAHRQGCTPQTLEMAGTRPEMATSDTNTPL